MVDGKANSCYHLPLAIFLCVCKYLAEINQDRRQKHRLNLSRRASTHRPVAKCLDLRLPGISATGARIVARASTPNHPGPYAASPNKPACLEACQNPTWDLAMTLRAPTTEIRVSRSWSFVIQSYPTSFKEESPNNVHVRCNVPQYPSVMAGTSQDPDRG